MALRERVPREFSDDVRWYRFFTQKMILIILVEGIAGLILCKILSLLHMAVVGFVISILFIILSILFVSVPMPKDDLLKGAGLTIGTVLMRKRAVEKRGKQLYIKNFKGDKKIDNGTDY